MIRPFLVILTFFTVILGAAAVSEAAEPFADRCWPRCPHDRARARGCT